MTHHLLEYSSPNAFLLNGHFLTLNFLFIRDLSSSELDGDKEVLSSPPLELLVPAGLLVGGGLLAVFGEVVEVAVVQRPVHL